MYKFFHFANNNKMKNDLLKKLIIGTIAGLVTGLFGSGGRNDTCASFYFYITPK